MTIFVSFVMGPKEAYFFNSPTHWAWRNLPLDVENLFTKQPPIRDVLELAIGENGTYFVSFREQDGQISCRHYNLPNPLTTFLYGSQPNIIRDLITLSITLGPYESYYAYDKNAASWSNLPPLLEKAVLSRLDFQDSQKTVWKEGGRQAPSFVCLGADGSYFMRTVAGGGNWDLKHKDQFEGMKGINKFLEDAPDFTNVAGLYLFPNSPPSYILLLCTGKAYSNLPEHTWNDYNKMAPHLPATMQTQMPIPPVPQPRPAPQTQPLPPNHMRSPSQTSFHSQHSQQSRFSYDPNARSPSNGMFQGPNQHNGITPSPPPLQPQYSGNVGYYPPTQPTSYVFNPHTPVGHPFLYPQPSGGPRYYNGQPVYWDGYLPGWRVQPQPAISPQTTGMAQMPPQVQPQPLSPPQAHVHPQPQSQVQPEQQPHVQSQPDEKTQDRTQDRTQTQAQAQGTEPQQTGLKRAQSNNYTKTVEDPFVDP